MMSTEVDPLLTVPRVNSQWLLKLKSSCKPKYLCLSSKAAIVIILLAAVVGMIFNTIKDLVALSIIAGHYAHIMDIAILDLIPYATLMIIMIFYPLSGFIADVYCGRFKIAMISLTFMLASLLLLGIVSVLVFHMTELKVKFNPSDGEAVVGLIQISVTIMLFIIGLGGFQANYIQLGLDQLLEAPSEHLGLFIHYATWVFTFSQVLDIPLLTITNCKSLRKKAELSLTIVIPSTLTILFLPLYIITCWKRHKWFLVEPGQNNPYKIVYKVLKFAIKHKYPLQRSAFTYADDYIPNRVDFAKERYGGPFTTEQVENVKTLLRIVMFLLAMGPVFTLQLSSSHYIFPLFSYHAGKTNLTHFIMHNCSSVKLMTRTVDSGGLIPLFAIILFPLYIWMAFSVLRRNMLKIFTRLGIGIILTILGVVSMLIIDMVGHSLNGYETLQRNSTVTQCMFQISRHNYTIEHNPLNMHWSVFIVPSLFLGIGPLLITTTTLELISAQSPQSMKGLLVGVFFAIQGICQLFGITAILPVSLTQPWPLSLPSVVSCCSVYLGFLLLMGLTGFILFTFAAKKYKYRKRDDVLFRQADIEEVYTRYLKEASDMLDNSNENDYIT